MRDRLLCLILLSASVPFLVAFAPHDQPGTPLDSSLFAAPVGIGNGGPFNSSNMQVLGHLPLSEIGGGPSNIFANDCWGWTDAETGREFAIVGLEHGTSFVEVTNPTDPKFLGFLPTQTGVATWRDVKIFDDHAFVVSDNNGAHGMQVFNLLQLLSADPANPATFSNTAFYSGVDSSHNIAINEQTGFAYIVGSNRADGGLHVVDINNPTNPTFAGDFADAGYCHDCQVIIYAGPDPDYAGRELAFCCNGRTSGDGDALVIVDVTDKSNMTEVSNTNYPEASFAHQGWLTEDHRYFYLGDELDELDFGGRTRLLVWDCLDLDNPVFLGVVLGPTGAIDHNLYIRDDKLFLANYSAGLRVFQLDPENPLNLTEIAFADTFATDNDNDFDGAWSNFPYFESRTIIVSDRQNGLFTVALNPIKFEFPDGRPDQINPSGDAEFEVVVSGFDGTPQPGTGVLHVDRGNGFETFAMEELSPNVYQAVFPETPCGSTVNYFVSAKSESGVEVCIPADAPAGFFQAISGDSIDQTFIDNFETNQGWSVTGDANEGQWNRGVPLGAGDRGDPEADADGSGACFLTGNEPGNSDIDGGTTILTSPLMSAVNQTTETTAFINYYRWYSNDVGNAPAADIFVVEISNDGGNQWVELETVGPAGNEVSGGWIFKSFEISNFLTPTNQMRVRFIASDLGEGSVVEAGVDAVEVTLVDCAPSILLGDVNLDGVVDLLDVSPFVERLTGGEFQAEADINGDGNVDLLDVSPFVSLLVG